ncbi:MAG TPA: hypothetical protein PLR38_04815 [Syntrophorhabdaceae bacterium]|nr:hypothetical protein [Syntrophorhabdaceae bacterium]HOL04850.1 hypothetical protein [Syntrophorhabdaceae bacterium]HQG79221.1 hypothetical protein [bacterium]
MSTYTFKIKDKILTVDAFDIDDALNKAGIDPWDEYELIESEDDFENKCFLSAITDDILFNE